MKRAVPSPRALFSERVASQIAELEASRLIIDLGVDATGGSAVAERITDFITNGGVGLFLGVCPSDAKTQFAPFELLPRQITPAGPHSISHNIPQALDELRAYRDAIARIVSHRMALSEIAEFFSG